MNFGKTRPRDLLWDALVEELGDVTTKTERGVRNGALRELREAGATPEDIRSRCQAYRRMWPNVSLTAAALKKHWSALAGTPRKTTPSVADVVNLPEVSEAERQENLRRARALASGIGKEIT